MIHHCILHAPCCVSCLRNEVVIAIRPINELPLNFECSVLYSSLCPSCFSPTSALPYTSCIECATNVTPLCSAVDSTSRWNWGLLLPVGATSCGSFHFSPCLTLPHPTSPCSLTPPHTASHCGLTLPHATSRYPTPPHTVGSLHLTLPHAALHRLTLRPHPTSPCLTPPPPAPCCPLLPRLAHLAPPCLRVCLCPAPGS